ncbi:MAG: TetR family transcriptional regulator [Desulfobacter sp.]|nr:MAG: TetR family transcriptional regulator [Desulfobacter sp.]
MKISKAKKQENRSNIIQAFADLVIEKDLKTATMRDAARKAGLGDATIYNYFPTKEAIVYGYYEDKLEEAVSGLKAIPDFNEFTFQEQLQTFFETLLTLYTADREFLDKTFKSAFFTLSQQQKRLRPVKDKYTAVVRDIFEAAVEADEIPDQVFMDIIIQVYWEFYLGLIIYWLGDDSDGFHRTSVLMDKSLDLSCSAIRAGIANKVFDIGLFLFKNHVLSRMDRFGDRVEALHGIKRKFMEKSRE